MFPSQEARQFVVKVTAWEKQLLIKELGEYRKKVSELKDTFNEIDTIHIELVQHAIDLNHIHEALTRLVLQREREDANRVRRNYE